MLAEKTGIDVTPKYAKKPVNFAMTAGYRPCKAGGVTAEGSFGAPLALSLIEDTGLMGVIGSTNSIEGVILAQRGEETVHVYASGTVVARGGDEENTRKLIELAEKTIRRAISCTGCGVCVGQCASHAISVNGTARVNEKCTRCGKCTRACPVVKFG
jgi:phosphoadenosine phosphosulfate reductase